MLMDNNSYDKEFCNEAGPDCLIPAKDVFTWVADEGVKIRIGKEGMSAISPISIVSAFRETVRRCPNQVALMYKEEESWNKISYLQYLSLVEIVAKAFIHLGLEKNKTVGIIGFNSVEWFVADLAAIFAGAFACGIYSTNSADACAYVAKNAQCQIIVVENDVQLKKFINQIDNLPLVKAIIQYKGSLTQKYPNVYTWAQMMKMGTEEYVDELNRRISGIAPNKCSTLIYTSGTTGDPKGVMLSHDNLIWTAKSLFKYVSENLPANFFDIIISYLPLSHIAAQLLDIYLPLVSGATIAFAQPDALKGSLSTTLKEIRPTVFLGVPRVWEKMKEAMVEIGKKNNVFKKQIISWAKETGFQGNIDEMNGQSKPMCFYLANKLVFSKVRQQLGFDRVRIFVSGAAPNSHETINFFLGLNIPIMDAYGMSESSAPHCVNKPGMFRIYTVGKEIPGVTTLLANPDASGEGEVCMSGRHVFMGYLNEMTKTKEVIDSEGWLHSGDLGKRDSNGFVTITGRIKELLITAGGENVPPVPIEDKLKEFLPCVSNCMLIGDKKKFLSMLIAIKTVINSETQEPMDNLTSSCIEWFKEKNVNVKSLSEIIKQRDPVLMKLIQDGIDAVNRTAISRAQYIQKWTLLPRDFSVIGGELGPTLKLRRSIVCQMYKETIDAFYLDDKSN